MNFAHLETKKIITVQFTLLKFDIKMPEDIAIIPMGQSEPNPDISSARGAWSSRLLRIPSGRQYCRLLPGR